MGQSTPGPEKGDMSSYRGRTLNTKTLQESILMDDTKKYIIKILLDQGAVSDSPMGGSQNSSTLNVIEKTDPVDAMYP
eukprot:3048510-Ditylum_brightwellii.AAC.1